jgi:hypothetical protein
MLKNLKLINIFKNFKSILLPNNQNIFIYLLAIFYLLILFLTTVFGRPFVGFYIFNQQIGKGFVLIGALFLLNTIFLNYIFKNKFEVTFKSVINFSLLIFFGFLLNLVVNGFNTDTYIFKSSSYIWSLGYFFIGYYFLSKLKKELVLLVVSLSAIANYFISIINYPNFIIDIFISNSDKFQLVKAADSLLIFILLNFFIEKYLKSSENIKFAVLIFSFGLFLPYYIYQSRGSLLAALLFFSLSLLGYRKFIFKNILISIIYSVIAFLLFYGSSYSIAFISVGDELLPDNFSDANAGIIDNILTEKEPRSGFLTFYIEDSRLKSLDATTDWRLDIWQDLIDDLILKNKLLIGFGYLEPFEIMNDPAQPGRLGRDGLNEHVHNYFFNILGRGGILQLLLFIFFYISIFKLWIKKNYKKIDFIKLFLPILIVSSLDVTMEGVHFPFIFLSFLGYILSSDYN